MGKITALQPLSENHVTDNFDCGSAFLNDWPKKIALMKSRANATKMFVVGEQNEVIGYYSLAMGSVDYEVTSSRIKRGWQNTRYPLLFSPV